MTFDPIVALGSKIVDNSSKAFNLSFGIIAALHSILAFSLLANTFYLSHTDLTGQSFQCMVNGK